MFNEISFASEENSTATRIHVQTSTSTHARLPLSVPAAKQAENGQSQGFTSRACGLLAHPSGTGARWHPREHPRDRQSVGVVCYAS
jgi:hypothetical protein